MPQIGYYPHYKGPSPAGAAMSSLGGALPGIGEKISQWAADKDAREAIARAADFLQQPPIIPDRGRGQEAGMASLGAMPAMTQALGPVAGPMATAGIAGAQGSAQPLGFDKQARAQVRADLAVKAPGFLPLFDEQAAEADKEMTKQRLVGPITTLLEDLVRTKAIDEPESQQVEEAIAAGADPVAIHQNLMDIQRSWRNRALNSALTEKVGMGIEMFLGGPQAQNLLLRDVDVGRFLERLLKDRPLSEQVGLLEGLNGPGGEQVAQDLYAASLRASNAEKKLEKYEKVRPAIRASYALRQGNASVALSLMDEFQLTMDDVQAAEEFSYMNTGVDEAATRRAALPPAPPAALPPTPPVRPGGGADQTIQAQSQSAAPPAAPPPLPTPGAPPAPQAEGGPQPQAGAEGPAGRNAFEAFKELMDAPPRDVMSRNKAREIVDFIFSVTNSEMSPEQKVKALVQGFSERGLKMDSPEDVTNILANLPPKPRGMLKDFAQDIPPIYNPPNTGRAQRAKKYR